MGRENHNREDSFLREKKPENGKKPQGEERVR